jgi:hypothetical protein
MTTFTNAVQNQSARTLNGMKALQSTTDANVDLFFGIGAARGQNIIPKFVAAFVENKELALRIAQWCRDIRGGSGERQIFKDIVKYLETVDPASAEKLLYKIPELGRFDDLFAVQTRKLKDVAFSIIKKNLEAGNSLAAKWCPRTGKVAAELRNYLKMTPREYRKYIVGLTHVVETQMCAKDWDNINFSQVPSVAAARYKKAFNRNTEKFAEYVLSLVNGDPSVKVNANAVYPYDVLKGMISTFPMHKYSYDFTELNHIIAQWDALPDYVGDASILPLVDVSGSMMCPAGSVKRNLSCMDVAVSLGLYVAEKNKGVFKDTFLTFSTEPQLLHLKGNIVEKMNQMSTSKWSMSTNLHSAMNKILKTAIEGNVSQEDMPKILLILSDMQFDQGCPTVDETGMEMITRKFNDAGYKCPLVVFWNLHWYDNFPVKADKSGVALVSGFSPALLKGILSADMEQFTPMSIMMSTVMIDRYNV